MVRSASSSPRRAAAARHRGAAPDWAPVPLPQPHLADRHVVVAVHRLRRHLLADPPQHLGLDAAERGVQPRRPGRERAGSTPAPAPASGLASRAARHRHDVDALHGDPGRPAVDDRLDPRSDHQRSASGPLRLAIASGSRRGSDASLLLHPLLPGRRQQPRERRTVSTGWGLPVPTGRRPNGPAVAGSPPRAAPPTPGPGGGGHRDLPGELPVDDAGRRAGAARRGPRAPRVGRRSPGAGAAPAPGLPARLLVGVRETDCGRSSRSWACRRGGRSPRRRLCTLRRPPARPAGHGTWDGTGGGDGRPQGPPAGSVGTCR